MNGLVSPILLFAGCILGALGVGLALPRRGLNPQLLGALVAGAGLGAICLALGLHAGQGNLPNPNFYVFSFVALGAALRVISHPRPVYAALYFILTIVASCGLYVLLSAEFMAFALIIVYAGAILITYLFVLMLATESPTADQVESLSEYDRYSREPAIATIFGFLLIAALTGMLARGAGELRPPATYAGAKRIELLPKKIDTAFREAGLIAADEKIAIDPARSNRAWVNLFPAAGELASIHIAYGKDFANTRVVTSDNPKWPAFDDLQLTNVEGVGFTLLSDHPGAIEVAGVILLMAMIGAVVLARKKVELDEREKLAAQARLLGAEFTPEQSPLMAPPLPGAPMVRDDLREPIIGPAHTNGHTGKSPVGGRA